MREDEQEQGPPEVSAAARAVLALHPEWEQVRRKHDLGYWQIHGPDFPRRWILLPPGCAETWSTGSWELEHTGHQTETRRVGDPLDLLVHWATLKDQYP